MRRLITAAAAILSFETAAFACDCTPPEAESERRDIARRIAARAVAIAEVEPVSGPDIQRQVGDTYRIVKVLYGHAATGPIRMERMFGRSPQTGELWMGGTSCDVFPGYRKRVLLIQTGFAPEQGGAIIPAFTMPGKQCGQILPIRDAPADLASRGYEPVFSFGSTCEDAFIWEEVNLALVREEARKMGRPLGR